MQPETIVTLLTTSASIAFLWICHFWLYKNYRVDVFRQKMFALRDRLFDEAADGVIAFDHPAYCTMHRTINGCIRFAHKLDLLQAVLILVFVDEKQLEKNNTDSFEKRINGAMEGLTPEVTEKIHAYRREMRREILIHCFFISPFLSVLCLVPVSLAIVIAGLQKFKDFVFNNVKGIESTALSYGQLG